MVDLGAEAVKLGPRSALAHTFYSEALADGGNTDAARTEIDAATPLASTAYEKAEVEREKATLAMQTGDKAGGLAHFEAARDLQPEWAERIRELAAWYHGTGQTDKSVALFNEAVQKAPKDAELRLTLANIGLEKQDMALAATALTAANEIKPHDSDVESALAIADFCQTRDAARAEALLRGRWPTARRTPMSPTSSTASCALSGRTPPRLTRCWWRRRNRRPPSTRCPRSPCRRRPGGRR